MSDTKDIDSWPINSLAAPVILMIFAILLRIINSPAITTLPGCYVLIGVMIYLAATGVGALAASEISSARLLLIMSANAGIFVVIYSVIYQTQGMLISGGGRTHSFVDALYMSIVTWTTLGFGDRLPVPGMELVVASQALVGYFYLGTIVGVATSLVLQKNPVRPA